MRTAVCTPPGERSEPDFARGAVREGLNRSPAFPGCHATRCATSHSGMLPSRRSIRCPGYDYGRPGGYFVTIGTWRMRSTLGWVTAAGFQPNDLGRIAAQTWQEIPRHFPTVALDTWCVMPNHVHGIVWLQPEDGSPRLRPALGLVVRMFKASAARRINRILGQLGVPVWHRNYYERIIRSRDALEATRRYIELNPRRWWEAKRGPLQDAPWRGG